MRDHLSRVLGAHFDRTMSPEQIAANTRYLATPAGQALIQSFFSLDTPTLANAFRGVGRVERPSPAVEQEFARRTSDLPRQQPPPSLIPVPPPATPRAPPVPPPPISPPPPPPPR